MRVRKKRKPKKGESFELNIDEEEFKRTAERINADAAKLLNQLKSTFPDLFKDTK